MTRVVTTLILILFIGLLSAEVITLEQAKEIAIERNLDYKSQQETYNSAKWNYTKSITSLFPSASLSASYTNSQLENPGLGSAVTERGSYGLSVNQPIFQGGRIITGARISKDAQKMSKLTLSEKELEILNTTEEKYYSMIEAMRVLEISTKQLESAELRINDAQTKFDQGTISRADLLKFQADGANTQVSLIQSQLAYDVSYRDLKNYLLMSEDFEIEDESHFSVKEEVDSIALINPLTMKSILSRMTEYTLENNNSLKSLRISKDIASKNLLMTKSAFLPSINLGYSYNYNGDFDDDFADYPWSSTLSITASMPIFPLVGTYSDVAKSKSDLKKTEYDYTNTENGFSLNVESSLLNLFSSAHRFKASTLSLDYSLETYEQMQERYKNGLISSTDLLDAEVAYKSAQINEISSKFTYLKTRANLKKLLGLSDDNEIIRMIIEN